MIRLVCIVEVEDADTVEEAEEQLTAFRECVLPGMNYGITIYRATERDADAAQYQTGGERT